MEVEGLQRFAILYPSNPYGETTRDLFFTGVRKRGGTIARAVAYDPEAPQFLDTARELGQKDYKARASEFWRLKKEAERNNRDVDKVTLPPVIDFDAIFIPDSWQRVPLVASSLAYEEFPVGSFRPFRGAERMPLLGLNGWDNDKIVETGGAYLEDAVFVDAFYAGSDDPRVRSFETAYKADIGREPGVVDALVWDASRLLANAVIAGGDSRDAVRQELSRVRIDSPASGGDHFTADRELARTLHVLTIDNGKIRPWVPPEELLPPEGIELPAP